MDTKAIRQKILDLAIRGKLVPQDPNDEPAEVLLERIREQKQQMLKEGKLKKKDIKNDTIIFKGEDNLHYEKFQDGTVKCIEDEIPFEVPEGWEWARLRDICMMSAGKSKSSDQIKSEPFEGSYPCFGGNGVRGYVDEYNQDGTFSIVGRQGALCGNINIASGKFYATEHAVVTTLFAGIDFKWSNYILEALRLNNYATGAAQPGLSVANILNVFVPVPPIQEQDRISSNVDESLKIAEVLEQEKIDLQRIIITAKRKILDLAIRGKLVPQDPNDEPASVLLERIRAEKEELIKQGKIKRNKKESVIFKGDDNSYYQDLPENWQFTSLREITTSLTLNDGDWILSQNMSNIGDVKLLQLGSIGNMVYIDKGFKYLTKDIFKELSCTEIFSGYLLINRIISDKMCCCIVPDIDGTIITTVDTCWIAPSNTSYDIKFLMYQLASPTFQKEVLLKASGTTRRRISKNNLINIALLLPPLAEQKRIVTAIEEAFFKLDKISEALT